MKYKNNKINKLALAAGLTALLSVNCALASAAGVDVFTDRNYQADVIDLGNATLEKNVVTKTGRAVDAQIKLGAAQKNYTITWGQMNVPKAKTLDFNFAKNGQTALNKVTSGLTKVAGSITTSGSNGRVIISNPNGIMMENGAYVNANSLMLTTHDASFSGNNLNLKKVSNAGVLIKNAKLELDQNLTIASSGIKITSADIMAGNSISLITSDGASFKINSNSGDTTLVDGSLVASTVAPNQVLYAGKNTNTKNSISVAGTSKAVATIKTNIGNILMVSEGSLSKIALSHVEHSVAREQSRNSRGLIVKSNTLAMSNVNSDARLEIETPKQTTIYKSTVGKIVVDRNNPALLTISKSNTGTIEFDGNKNYNASTVKITGSNIGDSKIMLRDSALNISSTNVDGGLEVRNLDSVALSSVKASGTVKILSTAKAVKLNKVNANRLDLNWAEDASVSSLELSQGAEIKNVRNKLTVKNLKAAESFRGFDLQAVSLSGLDVRDAKVISKKSISVNGFKADNVDINAAENLSVANADIAGEAKLKGLNLKVQNSSIDDIVATAENFNFNKVSADEIGLIKNGKTGGVSIKKLSGKNDDEVDVNFVYKKNVDNFTLSTQAGTSVELGDIYATNSVRVYADNIASDGEIVSHQRDVIMMAKGNINLDEVKAQRHVRLNGENVSNSGAVTASTGSIVIKASNKADVENLSSAKTFYVQGLESVDVEGASAENITLKTYEEATMNDSGLAANKVKRIFVERPAEPEVIPPTPVSPEVVPPVAVTPEPEVVVPAPVAPELEVQQPVKLNDGLTSNYKKNSAEQEAAKVANNNNVLSGLNANNTGITGGLDLISALRQNVKGFASNISSKFSGKFIKTNDGFKIVN